MNAKILLFVESIKNPIISKLTPSSSTPLKANDVSIELPLTFCNNPESIPSEFITSAFLASMYSFLDISLGLRSLFILAPVNIFLTSAIFYDFIHLDLPLIT